MNLISFVGIGIGVTAISMIFLIFKADTIDVNNKPYLLSLVALSLIILNWVLYIAGFYNMIPEKIAGFIFLPIWFIVSIIGLIAAYKEFRNNRIFAIVNSGLAIISTIVGILLWGIGNM